MQTHEQINEMTATQRVAQFRAEFQRWTDRSGETKAQVAIRLGVGLRAVHRYLEDGPNRRFPPASVVILMTRLNQDADRGQ